MDSKLKVKDIISYFDEGGNVIIVGDVDSSISFRKLFYSFGVNLDETVILILFREPLSRTTFQTTRQTRLCLQTIFRVWVHSYRTQTSLCYIEELGCNLSTMKTINFTTW